MKVVRPITSPGQPSPETVPAKPMHEDQRAGDLQVGGYLVDNYRTTRVRRRRKIPFGFRAPEVGK